MSYPVNTDDRDQSKSLANTGSNDMLIPRTTSLRAKSHERLTFSNVVSVISLLFALGLGSAWAATELSKNEVKSKHIKNAGVKTKDLANNAVTSPKVADGSLLNQDFAAGQLPAGPQGPQGPQGERGPQGEQGPRGPSGLTNLTVRTDTAQTCTGEGCEVAAVADCAAGERAVGGGGVASLFDDITGTHPTGVTPAGSNPTAWRSIVSEEHGGGDGDARVTPYVVCASP